MSAEKDGSNVTPIRPGANAVPKWVPVGLDGRLWELDLQGIQLGVAQQVVVQMELMPMGARATIRWNDEQIHLSEHATLQDAGLAVVAAVVLAEKLRWRP